MVYDIQSTSTQSNSRVAGIQMCQQNNPKIYYNTVYLSGTGSSPLGSAALYISSNCTNVEAKNNIFVNTRNESPYVASAIYDYGSGSITSDYNDLYSNNHLVRIGSTNYSTLANWQATGKDMHSYNEMPHFASTDLHLNWGYTTMIDGHATPIAGITTDFDGEPRNALTPDIGADEGTANTQWTEQTSGVTTALQSISAVDNNVAWISGDGGAVLRTTNGGTNWTNVGGGTLGTGVIGNIFAWDANFALCTTTPTASFVYRTTDGGVTWTQVFTQTGGFIASIWMFTSNDGFMVGDPVGGRWSLWKTTNGGATWDSTGLYLAQNGTEYSWISSIYVNGSNIYFGTNNSRIYYSSNMGASWTAQTMPLTDSYGIWFNSPTRGIVSGGPQGLVSTTNGGTNWNPLASLGTGYIFSVIGYQNGWYYTRETRLFKSTDDGATWDTAYVAAAGTYYMLSSARNGDVAWGIRSNGGITKGTNIGLPVELTSFTASANGAEVILNWSTATELNNYGFEIQRKALDCDFATVAFVKGQGTTTQQNQYSFADKNLDEGKYFYRLKQMDYGGQYSYSQTVEVDVRMLNNYSLEQNYPNPFNPTTTIGYVLQEKSNAKLTLLNSLGEEIAVLVNGEQDKGYHKVEFDATKLSSGVYFYKLTTGNFISTRKMMLLK